MTRNSDEKPQVIDFPRVSARMALLSPLRLKSRSELKAIARKLQKLGQADNPNDPRLSR